MNILESKVKGLKDDINGKHYMSWMGFEFAISEMVKEYKRTNQKCEAIFGPPRGGLPIAVTLSHRLDIPIVSSWKDLDTTMWVNRSKNLKQNVMTQSTNDDKWILIVDDIADTGKTLLEGLDEIRVYCDTENAIDVILSILKGVS